MSFPRYATDWRNVGIFKRVHSVREMRQRENRSGGARALLEWVKDANDALASASAQRRSHEDEGMGKVGGRMKLCKWTPPLSHSRSALSLRLLADWLWRRAEAERKKNGRFGFQQCRLQQREGWEGMGQKWTRASRRHAQLLPENKPCMARDPSGSDRTVIKVHKTKKSKESPINLQMVLNWLSHTIDWISN